MTHKWGSCNSNDTQWGSNSNDTPNEKGTNGEAVIRMTHNTKENGE